jgi:hypothetical protein
MRNGAQQGGWLGPRWSPSLTRPLGAGRSQDFAIKTVIKAEGGVENELKSVLSRDKATFTGTLTQAGKASARAAPPPAAPPPQRPGAQLAANPCPRAYPPPPLPHAAVAVGCVQGAGARPGGRPLWRGRRPRVRQGEPAAPPSCSGAARGSLQLYKACASAPLAARSALPSAPSTFAAVPAHSPPH